MDVLLYFIIKSIIVVVEPRLSNGGSLIRKKRSICIMSVSEKEVLCLDMYQIC